MVANVSPIFLLTPIMTWGSLTAANTAMDGTGTVLTVFTADAVNGGYLERIRFRPLGTNAASLARIFLNNGLTNVTVANNSLIDDILLPVSTLSQTAQQLGVDWFLNRQIPVGYKLNVTLATAVAAGWQMSSMGGNY